MFHKHVLALADARLIRTYDDPSYGNGGHERFTGYKTYLDAVCINCGKTKTKVVDAQLTPETARMLVKGMGWLGYNKIIDLS